MPPRRRITVAQKLALRERRRTRLLDNYYDFQRWFRDTFDQQISTSSICDILGTRFKHLEDPKTAYELTAKSNQKQHWPELENALFAWLQYAEQSTTITGDIVKLKAREFWAQMPQYKDLLTPAFSNGWIYRFQARRDIKSRVKYGEVGSVDVMEVEKEMAAIRLVLLKYSSFDIFNCDEISLYWKMVPDRSLTTKKLPGIKKEKARITAHFCCNWVGTKRLPIWFIGKAKKPRAFTAAKVNIANMGMVWRNNKKAWMTGVLFEEWLRWFDGKMAGRKVALLMDNFSAHESAVEAIAVSDSPLQNTVIIWLPPNSTSRVQPLDQGIIRTWKSYWKQQWVRFMVSEFDVGREPVNTMNVLRAVRWGIQAWELDVKLLTIIKCFTKGILEPLLDIEISIATAEVVKEITEGLTNLRVFYWVQEVMSIENFLNPPDEDVFDQLDDIEADIIAQYSVGNSEQVDDDSDVEMELLEERKVTTAEALEALRQLRLYQEQSGGDTALITSLNAQERVLVSTAIRELQQTDIRRFFN